jgi:hypothetical protein
VRRPFLPLLGSQLSVRIRKYFRRCASCILALWHCPYHIFAMRFDPTDYSVVVKLRAPPPNPWRWEIYRAGRGNAVEQAPAFFPTMAAASRAGKVALKEFLDKLQSQYLPRPAA